MTQTAINLYQFKPRSKREVEIWHQDAAIGNLRRGTWASVSGSFNNQAIALRMPVLTFKRRWYLEVDGKELAVARNGRALGLVKNAEIFLFDFAATSYVFARPHRDAYEWRLDAGDQKLGDLTVTIGWRQRTPLELDLELAEVVPAVLVPFLGYLASRAFTARGRVEI